MKWNCRVVPKTAPNDNQLQNYSKPSTGQNELSFLCRLTPWFHGEWIRHAVKQPKQKWTVVEIPIFIVLPLLRYVAYNRGVLLLLSLNEVIGKIKINFVFRSACTTLPCGEDRRHLGKIKINFVFRSVCTTLPYGEDRRRLNKLKKKQVFLAFVFGLHYLCRRFETNWLKT